MLLPVFVRGALFSCGDGHAAQGDGEVCGSAIETHMLVKARLTVIKPGAGGLQPSAPLLQYLTPGKEVVSLPRYRWHLGCIPPRVPAVSLSTGPARPSLRHDRHRP